MNKQILKQQVETLLLDRDKTEKKVKELVWINFYSKVTKMPDTFPWKKTLREELGVVI